jgi:hypothetical protein
MSRSPRAAALAALVLAAAGCGGPRAYPVEGVVKYDDGSPATALAGGTVSLESVADRSNAAGTIQPDGTFRIKGPTGRDGVPSGAYRVVVLPKEGAGRRNPPVDPAFGRYETSGIEIAVKEEPNKLTVTVRRPAGGPKE